MPPLAPTVRDRLADRSKDVPEGFQNRHTGRGLSGRVLDRFSFLTLRGLDCHKIDSDVGLVEEPFGHGHIERQVARAMNRFGD
jgi:hypothetical protein